MRDYGKAKPVAIKWLAEDLPQVVRRSVASKAAPQQCSCSERTQWRHHEFENDLSRGQRARQHRICPTNETKCERNKKRDANDRFDHFTHTGSPSKDLRTQIGK